MKKRVYALIMCFVLAIALCACGNSSTADQTPEAEKTPITISFYHGDELLGTVDGYTGEPITGYEKFENLEGYTFQGWYVTPTFIATSKKDLTTATFTKDKSLFGSFKSNTLTEDTRTWYIVGSSSKSAVLMNSAWAGSSVSDEDKAACQLKATGNAVNEFSITLDLYADDLFQLVYDWQWDGQKGYGCFKNLDEAQMTSGGGLSDDKNKTNVQVVMDGNYTITLTTDPEDSAQDTITVVRNGDAAPAEAVEEEPFVPGETTQVLMKGSWVSDWSENVEFTRNEGTNVYVGTKELTAGTELYFMVWDNGADTGIGMKGENVVDDASKALIDTTANNVKVLADGTYTFTVDVDALTITITK